MLTFMIELEGTQACIDCSRDGPHSGHRQLKGLLLRMDVHEAGVIGGGLLRLVFAGFILSKGQGKRVDHYHPPPGEHEFKTVCSSMFPKSSLLGSILGAETLLAALKSKH